VNTAQGSIIAAWCPGWYSLDQPIHVGMENVFYFWRLVPEYLRGSETLVFYNTLWRTEDVLVARGVIERITHSQLGSIQSVVSTGFDYVITLDDDSQLLVNAEEEPGRIFEQISGEWVDSPISIADWRIFVELKGFSELKPAEGWPQPAERRRRAK
jgi:hypothetical protein